MKNFFDILVSGGGSDLSSLSCNCPADLVHFCADLQHLSVLVYTLCLTCKSPVDVFPYSECDMFLLKKVLR